MSSNSSLGLPYLWGIKTYDDEGNHSSSVNALKGLPYLWGIKTPKSFHIKVIKILEKFLAYLTYEVLRQPQWTASWVVRTAGWYSGLPYLWGIKTISMDNKVIVSSGEASGFSAYLTYEVLRLANNMGNNFLRSITKGLPYLWGIKTHTSSGTLFMASVIFFWPTLPMRY